MKKIALFFLLMAQLVLAQNELMHEVYFDTDKFEMVPKEHERLLLFLADIEKMDIEKISIYGFTDDRGSDSYNMALSQNRANTIKEIFSNNEFDESIITNVDGKGELLIKLVEQQSVDEARSLNRKVQILVKPYFPPRVEAIPEKKDITTILKGELKAGDKFQLDNILFQTGYSDVLEESQKTLEDLAEVLLTRDDIYFTIQGHVCCTQYSRDAIDRKTKKRNLSVARAKFVYDYLAKKGVNPRRMKYVGMRRKFPLGGEPKYDRRVEILITYAGEND
jgi:outer membrane protein OmpA-like peptidoglycan-associated protein